MVQLAVAVFAQMIDFGAKITSRDKSEIDEFRSRGGQHYPQCTARTSILLIAVAHLCPSVGEDASRLYSSLLEEHIYGKHFESLLSSI